jgi:hypothetical protein
MKLRTLYWHASGWYLLILFNFLIYAIVALAVRKKVRISPGLCTHHARRRAWLLAGTGAAFAVFLGGTFAMISHAELGLSLMVLGFVGVAGCSLAARTIHAVHIDERGARFKGCGENFLRSLEGNRPY